MKLHPLFLLAAAAALPLVAGPASAQTSTSASAQPDDAAWKEVLAKLQRHEPFTTPDGAKTFLQQRIDDFTAFIKDHPKDPNAVQARIIRIQLQLNPLIAGKDQPLDIAPIDKELVDIATSADTPAPAKEMASVVRLQILALHGEPKALDEAVTAYEAAHPDKGLPSFMKTVIAKKLEAANPDKAKKLLAEAQANQTKAQEAQAKAQEAQNKRLNQPLNVKFTAVDGKEIDLQKLRGKVVLVDFWATWCGPCMMEVPNVVATYKKYHDKGFEIVGISFDQDKDALLKTTKVKGMTWPQYFDGKGWENAFGKQFGIDSIPRMWLVNKEGLLVDLNGRDKLEEKVAKLLE